MTKLKLAKVKVNIVTYCMDNFYSTVRRQQCRGIDLDGSIQQLTSPNTQHKCTCDNPGPRNKSSIGIKCREVQYRSPTI